MANIYTQLYIQLVFAAKNRDALIHEKMRQPVEKYMTGIVQRNGHKLLAIYCMPDHCHILIGLNPKQSISDLAKDVKADSTRWINNNKMCHFRFGWQAGYGAFSYAKSQLDKVVNYILNQPIHHKKQTFREEYLNFLNKFEVEYKEEYLFDWLEE